MNPVEVTNMPNGALWIIAISQLIFAGATLLLAVLLALTIKQMLAILQEMQSIVSDDVHKQIMPEVVATMKNVKRISDDATTTSHNVTGTVNHVTHAVSSVVQRLESPVIRGIGLLTGIAAGARALGGGKEETVVVERKKRRGLFGR